MKFVVNFTTFRREAYATIYYICDVLSLSQ